MPRTLKICRVCGKEYEACHTAYSDAGAFKWQDVACSPECGAEYLRMIRESRSSKVEPENSSVAVSKKKGKKKNKSSVEITEEDIIQE